MSEVFELIEQNDGMELYRLETEPFGTNTYIIICRETGESIIVDAPGDAALIGNKLKNSGITYILLTHGHIDHTMALEELYRSHASLGAILAAHEGDTDKLPVRPDEQLKDGDSIECGKLKLKVIHTPGHTAGSICFKIGNYLISGDTIFPGGPGKTASPEDFKTITLSIRDKILTLPNETIILPGHGASTTVKREKELFSEFSRRGYSDLLCGDVTWLDS